MYGVGKLRHQGGDVPGHQAGFNAAMLCQRWYSRYSVGTFGPRLRS